MKSSSRCFALLAALGSASLSCSREESPSPAPAAGRPNLPRGHYLPNEDQAADTEFLRFTDHGNGEGLMETAIVTYEGKNGEVVELISAVHVADAAYYARLEKLFAGYDSLLYELIKAKDAAPPSPGRKQRGNSTSMVSWFQRYLRDTLQLEFQLDAIEYRKPNFVHADLDADTFAKLSEERGEGIVQIMLKVALAEFSKASDPESDDAKVDPNLGMKMIAALFMPDRARTLKYLFAQQLQNMEAIMSGLGEGPDGEGSVLLIERNKQLVRVLRDRLQQGDSKIGVFFGGAHLSDVEKRIFAEIGLRRTGIRWEKAWVIARKSK